MAFHAAVALSGTDSSLGSSGVGPAVDGFVSQMNDLGPNTVNGVAMQRDATLGGAVVNPSQIDSTLRAFARELVDTAQ